MQNPKGTYDLWGDSLASHVYIRDVFFRIAQTFGYQEVITPVYEDAKVFTHTLGEESDIVQKEMFYLQEKKDRPMVLRPENTAGVMRLALQAGFIQDLPKMFSYFGPMFRYERPQKGRYRQFYQLGVEYLGSEGWLTDVQNMQVAVDFLKTLNIRDTEVQINYLGDESERSSYKEDLRAFLHNRSSDLSLESQKRLNRNVLRILDSKNEGDRNILRDAPVLSEHLRPETVREYALIKAALKDVGIAYKENPCLVRGLDYYNGLVFEVLWGGGGAQNALVGGGRYDSLSLQMGGKSTVPSVGWAAGVERLRDALTHPPTAGAEINIFASLSENGHQHSLSMAANLRANGVPVLVWSGMPLKKILKLASKIGAKFVMILGDKESSEGIVTVRLLKNSTQEAVPYEKLLSYIKNAAASS